MKYEFVLKSLENIIIAMDSAIKEYWKNYSGMMISVGRVFGSDATKRCLAEDVEGILKEIEETIPIRFKVVNGKIVVERCVVRDLVDGGVLNKDNTLCPFIRGFISKMFESIGVKATCENCEVKL